MLVSPQIIAWYLPWNFRQRQHVKLKSDGSVSVQLEFRVWCVTSAEIGYLNEHLGPMQIIGVNYRLKVAVNE